MKERKVFEIGNFRGIDKESKPLKVASFRASDGYNFIIDSETLKTRPAFVSFQNFPSFFEDGDFVVDWYEYQSYKIFITKYHFYIADGTNLYNENSGVFIKGALPVFDFENKKPVFQEEKDCLFIFCLGMVLVFSVLGTSEIPTEYFVLYDLKNKPANIFYVENDYYKIFEDLPKSYVPTLMIGDNRFEDVNLLSNKSKYKLFAALTQNAMDGKTTYYLPTNFQYDKHENFNAEVTLYKNEFANLNFFPVFLGKSGENFTDVVTTYGSVLNDSAPIVIADKFYPAKDFEYFGTKAGTTNETIYDIVNITKNDFFKLRVSDTNYSVFKHLVDYINNNIATLGTANKVIKFQMPIEYTAIFRDETTNFIKETARISEDVYVYVQLKYVDISVRSYDIFQDFSSAKVVEYTLTNPYPAYPTLSSPESTYDVLSDFNGGTPLKVNAIDFENVLNPIIKAHLNNQALSNGDLISIKARFYTDNPVTTPFSMALSLSNYWTFYAVDTTFTWDDASTIYDDFAHFSGEGQIITDVFLITTFGQTFDYSEGGFLFEQIKSVVEDAIITDGSLDDSGSVYVKIKVQTRWTSGGTTYYKAQSMVVNAEYQKAVIGGFEERISCIFTAEVVQGESQVLNDIYNISFNEKMNCFEFKIRDYFYDFNNEPSIEVEVEFNKNPDYALISGMTFGTVFGNENRLILAGHPDYKNIDRYNISNNLLGDNIKNQSYELSYFPSKNFCVLGGKGAINGYAVATDNHLYITKESYPNDNKLFVRQRNIDENGIVFYRDIKTSVNQTPLNSKCFVRFNNDILMLTKNGLYGIELSENVLTDERLIKLRSGLINKDMKEVLNNYDNAFIVENNEYLYIFIDNVVYVLDSRYLSKAEDNTDNIYYEIVKWISPNSFKIGHMFNNELQVLESTDAKVFYKLDFKNQDETMFYDSDLLAHFDYGTNNHTLFMLPSEYNYIVDLEETVHRFRFYSGYKYLAKKTTDYTISGNVVTIVNNQAFRMIEEGYEIYFKLIDGITYSKATVVSVDKNEFTLSFEYGVTIIDTEMYIDISNIDLYITHIIKYDIVGGVQTEKLFRLSLYKPDSVLVLTQGQDELLADFQERIETACEDYNDFIFSESGLLSCQVIKDTVIPYYWLSGILDFGNDLFEKTMFRLNIYATKKAEENLIYFGYKTMRRLKTLEDNTIMSVSKQVDLSNPFNLDQIDFNIFSINTFNEFGSSFPMKENNFLYMQIIIVGYGQIEVNSLKIIYKNNRLLKTIG